MDRFVLRENLRRYRAMLDGAADPATRRRLQALIAEIEREHLFRDHIWTWTCPHIAVPEVLGDAAERLLDRIVLAEGADLGSLQLWDEAAGALRLLAHHGFDRDSALRFAVVHDGTGSACEAAHARRQRVVIEDTETAEGLEATIEWSATVGVRAIQSTPVIREGRFLGVFSTYFRAPRHFGDPAEAVSAWHARQVAELLVQIG